MKRQEDKESIFVPPNFVLDETLAAAYHIMNATDETVFLTGRAGTGKSSLLNYFRKHTAKKYVVLAPTGLAALQVGGSTIHSFFGFPLRIMVENDPEIVKWSKSHPRFKILRDMNTLVIDEVSMLRADLLDAIDEMLRLNLDSTAPFGGKQVVFIGDVYQLAPVEGRHETELDGNDRYPNPYFFSARVFQQVMPRLIELKKIYRQNDENFIYLLNRIRMGIAQQDDIAELNKSYGPQSDDKPFAITLTSVNYVADMLNQKKLMNLRTPSFSFAAKVEGKFHPRLFPAPASLVLKEGAQVMMVKNDLHGLWVNGSIGVIEKLSERKISVRFQDGQVHDVDPVSWENKVYAWDRSEKKITFDIVGTFVQYPIRLAWAITIHKSQGLTFDHVDIDLGKGAFAHGQLYVALSRCRTLEGLRLRTRLKPTDMIVDEAVDNFAARFKIL